MNNLGKKTKSFPCYFVRQMAKTSLLLSGLHVHNYCFIISSSNNPIISQFNFNKPLHILSSQISIYLFFNLYMSPLSVLLSQSYLSIYLSIYISIALRSFYWNLAAFKVS
jgi:hypothetical protein